MPNYRNYLNYRLPLIVLLITVAPLCAQAKGEPAWFNSGVNNRDITFSPDGNVMLTTIMAPKNISSVIAVSYRSGGKWSDLEVAPFSGRFADIEAAFTPDGSAVYFSSKRPRPDREGSDWDIWRVSFNEGTWGTPENLGEPVNTAGDEFYPSIASNGNLYFTATRDDTLGREDLYRATGKAGKYTEVTNVGAPVNSATWEFNAFIAPDESYLIFGSQRREGEIGGGDLYISYNGENGFGEPRLLSRRINTEKLDYCPFVFDDRFYYTSEKPAGTDTTTFSTIEKMNHWYESPGNGLGDIYWVPFDSILD